MIKLGLVDDNKELLDLLSFDLDKVKDFEIAIKSENGEQFLREIKALENKPHIVLMDVEMPKLDGISTVQIAKAMYPDIYFIMFSVMDEEETLFKAIRAGAHGYILKEEPIDRIITQLKDVIENGSVPFSPIMATKALNLVKWSVPPSTGESDQLTDREIEILELLSDGFNSNEIAEKLFISFHTVRKHIRNIYDKLQVRTQAEAVKKGFLSRWLGF